MWRCVSLSNRGHDAAIVEADADLHAPQGDRRDALHQMRGSDEARPCRAAQSAIRFADLSMRQMRLCGEFPAADVDRGRLPNRPGRRRCYRFAACTRELCREAGWRIPAPETCDAIRKATTTAGTVIKRRNWSTDSIALVPQDTPSRLPQAGPSSPFAPSADRRS